MYYRYFNGDDFFTIVLKLSNLIGQNVYNEGHMYYHYFNGLTSAHGLKGKKNAATKHHHELQ